MRSIAIAIVKTPFSFRFALNSLNSFWTTLYFFASSAAASLRKGCARHSSAVGLFLQSTVSIFETRSLAELEIGSQYGRRNWYSPAAGGGGA